MADEYFAASGGHFFCLLRADDRAGEVKCACVLPCFFVEGI